MMHRSSHLTRALARRAAFTITELLVVISVVVIMIAIAVPALTNLIDGSERSLAENQLRVGISAGRDAAIRSDGGDGGVVFVHQFDSRGGRIVMIPVVQVASIDDVCNREGTASPFVVKRDIFAVVPNAQPVALPRGWGVRGFAPPGAIADSGPQIGWYEWLERPVGQEEGNWVFPETSFFDPANANLGGEGWRRQSFFVRFEAGTGALRTERSDLALVLDPVAEDAFRETAPWSDARVDRAPSQIEWLRRTARRTDLSPLERASLIGDESIDTILVRPITELVLYNESSMASGIGLRGLNRETGTLYLPVSGPTGGFDPQALGGQQPLDVAQNQALWIAGRFEINNDPVPSDARVFTLSKYLGGLEELKAVAP
jgi:type II secretory pathway pseudopilin PulG